MPITNRPDPNYEPTEVVAFSDGKYTVNGIQWFTVDEEGAPCFIVQSNSTSLVARYRTISGEQDGPPGSVSPGEVPLLVRAFGGDPAKLPSRDDPTAFLIAARDQINNANKEVTVEVRGGWVSSIPGMSLPKDQYFRFRVGRIGTRNEQEQPAWRSGDYGKFFGVEFEVVGDMLGNPTPYDGANTFEIISYGLKVGEDGDPEFILKDDGTPTPAASQTDRFLSAFCPSIYESGFENPGNVLPEFWDLYKKDRKVAVTRVILKGPQGKKRVGLDVYGFASVEAVSGDSTAAVPAREIDDETDEGPLMEHIYKAIADGTGEKAFASDGGLNSAGKAWCREHLAPFLTERGWPKRFDLWDEAQQREILKHLQGSSKSEDF